MSRVSHGIDRVRVSFDDPNLVANAGLMLVGTLVVRLGLERLVNSTVRLGGRVGGALPVNRWIEAKPLNLARIQLGSAGRAVVGCAAGCRTPRCSRTTPSGERPE